MNERKHSGFNPKPEHIHKDLDFPVGFLWGTSTSAHQVEGWNNNNDWWEWEHLPGTVADGQLSGRGADHYHKYQEDFDIAQRLGQNVHRLSIEWSRINPVQGRFDQKEIDHYIDVLNNLKKRGIKTMVTLHHFTNPLWFSKLGGFEKKNNIVWFINYVNKIVPQIKNYVDFWITINEPNVYVLMSYLLGIWPQGKISHWSAYKVFDNLANAHKQAYKIIHAQVYEAKVGIAHNVNSFSANSNRSFIQWAMTKFAGWFWNHWFLEKTSGYHDYLGINYYVHHRIKSERLRDLPKLFVLNIDEDRERSDLEWEIFPPGFYDALMEMSEYGLPIYVTENGISTVNDDRRTRYLVAYLKELYHAIQNGADIRGYLHWSLLDNFEWDKGFKSCFGLVSVNLTTLKRTLKGSAGIYKKICQNNSIDHDLLRFIGHGISPSIGFCETDDLRKWCYRDQ